MDRASAEYGNLHGGAVNGDEGESGVPSNALLQWLTEAIVCAGRQLCYVTSDISSQLGCVSRSPGCIVPNVIR